MILRRVLILSLRRALHLTADEAVRIATTLDEAVATSVSAYVTQRDRDLEKTNEELRRRNYELKRFAHFIAHEIRNPLSIIALAVGRMRRKCSLESAEIVESVATIDESVAAVNETITDLLQYAEHGDAGDGKGGLIDLNDVFDEACSLLRFLLSGSEAKITSDDLPQISGHRAALVGLFQNLIENAVKYSGESQPVIHISAERDGDSQILRFADNGVGVPSEKQEHIFRFLVRAHQESDVPGAGIGLAICRRVARQHGGDISIESEPGNGSVFIVRLAAGGADDSD